MSTATVQAPIIHAAPLETAQAKLAAETEKLAALRFFILLTARREGMDSLDPEGSGILRNDLAWLRGQYSKMIDEIAMKFGVQQAMNAKQQVEHEVSVPREWPNLMTEDAEQAR